ncbi:sulfotransferase family protein [Actinopolymorpha alba]|uniref:sulfotransferase family protein n=1 Tax=Actinopolymorpha alba TaxID=533267 RepID=UPI000A02DE92|nr:sulfotransferase [Actinopolymorpha alba]
MTLRSPALQKVALRARRISHGLGQGRPLRVKPSARLVRSPVFVICPPRSGSTLLRVLLNSHSQIHAPHELHLQTLGVTIGESYAETAVNLLGIDHKELEHLLWDRLLHRELGRSGKSVIVDKTPANALDWSRLAHCWPQARYLFLLRHPGSILESFSAARPGGAFDLAVAEVLEFVEAVDRARRTLPGHTVRYEDLTADPAATTQRICEFLEVPWEPTMLDYGKRDHGPFWIGLGDWNEKIRAGKVRPGRALPPVEVVPDRLRGIARRWGYLPS